ncbi:hypothetical protein D3C73_1368960 [compost metagenome]
MHIFETVHEQIAHILVHCAVEECKSLFKLLFTLDGHLGEKKHAVATISRPDSVALWTLYSVNHREIGCRVDLAGLFKQPWGIC